MKFPLASVLARDAQIAGHFSAEAEIGAMLTFERELAAAQGSLGLIPREAAEAIGEAALRLVPDITRIEAGMMSDGVPVPALVMALRAAIGEAHARHVHLGATSQDVVDTGLMLRLKSVLDELGRRCDSVLARLTALADAQGPLALMAQTRMQAALPFTVAAKIATWTAPLAGHRDRLFHLASELPLQLGGPVGDGASFGDSFTALRADLAARLGLRDVAPWHSDRTIVLDVAQGLSLVSGTLGKIGQDIALLAQSDRGAVVLASAGASSAMAHKRNPVGAEILVALARLNAGLLGTLAQSMVHENERSGAAWTLEWFVLPQMAQATGSALSQAEQLLAGLRFCENIGREKGPPVVQV